MEPAYGYTPSGPERGTYHWLKPSDAQSGKLSLEPGALAMLTDGIDLRDGMCGAWGGRE